MAAVQLQKIVALHKHVIKLKERQPSFQALLIALEGKHSVYREMNAHLPQKINIIQVQQPVPIICHQGFSIAEIN